MKNGWHGKQKTRGFTIVELLIVIVVIAILAAITIVSYNGIQQRARNAATISTIQQVSNLVLLYQTQMGKLPYEDSTTLCATLYKKCTTYDTASIDGTDNNLLMT